jgi:hypothetical protein
VTPVIGGLWLEDAPLIICMTPVVCPTSVGRRDPGRMPDFGRKIWLRSYILLRFHFLTSVDVTTLIVSPNSYGASQLQSMSKPHILPPQLWKTLHGWAKWLQDLTTWTLCWKQIGRDAWLVQHLKPQHLTASHIQELGHVPRDQQTLSPAWSKRNPSIQMDSVPPITWANQGLRMSG